MHLPLVTELCNGHFPLSPPEKKQINPTPFYNLRYAAQEFRKITVNIQDLPGVRITGSELSGQVVLYIPARSGVCSVLAWQ